MGSRSRRKGRVVESSFATRFGSQFDRGRVRELVKRREESIRNRIDRGQRRFKRARGRSRRLMMFAGGNDSRLKLVGGRGSAKRAKLVRAQEGGVLARILGQQGGTSLLVSVVNCERGGDRLVEVRSEWSRRSGLVDFDSVGAGVVFVGGHCNDNSRSKSGKQAGLEMEC